MRKKALAKDFRMEIRNSLNRFLSIFFIVALGVAFFAGIRASEPDMRYSGDAYFDARNMMDMKILRRRMISRRFELSMVWKRSSRGT